MRSEIKELLKKVHVGGYSGIPVLRACTQPDQLFS
jgi:hypothetical protein